MKKGKRGVLPIRSIGDDAEHSRVRLRIIRHMGRVRGSTDRVCVRVGGPIDFLAHVKAAREETLHNRPPPATSCDPRTPTRPTFLSSCRRFSPFFLPPNALTSRLPPMHLSRTTMLFQRFFSLPPLVALSRWWWFSFFRIDSCNRSRGLPLTFRIFNNS